MLKGATKVYIILASIGILFSNLTANEVWALFGCLLRFYGCVFLTYVLYILKQDAVPSQVYLRLGAVA